MQCPRCDGLRCFRTPRSWWQRLVPASRSYHCSICDTRFLAIGPLAWARDGLRRLAAAARA